MKDYYNILKLFFLLLLTGNQTVAQTKSLGTNPFTKYTFTSDSVNKSPNIPFNKKIKLEQIDESKAEVDIRLYEHFGLSNTKLVNRIFFSRNNWKAIEVDEFNKPRKIRRYKLIVKPGFDSLLLRLLSYNILTLPNQSLLRSKMHKIAEVTPDGDTLEKRIYVMDGVGYTIEFKIGNKFRVYQFDNPGSYSRIYDNVAELKDYLGIVQIFDKLTHR